ncbi:uncharacterized protein LOC135096440 [Scylla paramamosain]|uniref:uncharacterized protein LOC135096440 n=1 Tax=Scylla paramamosain TaxID=85552 RepID=UPI003083C21C
MVTWFSTYIKKSRGRIVHLSSLIDMKTLLLTAALLVASAGLVLGADSCTVSCEGKNPGDQVADPYNCTQFYVCLIDGPSDIPLPCEIGEHFEDGKCFAGEECTPQCIPKDCNIICKNPMDFIADPLDCSQYYICDASNVPLGPLPCDSSKPYFNGKSCTNDESQCCRQQCMAYCHSAGIQIIDPTDCHRYYICVKEGPANPDYRQSCGSGQAFDIASGHCKQGAQCVVLCPDGAGGGGDTSTPSSSECVSSMVCSSRGNFPKCPFCYREYFYCAGSGQTGAPQTCPDNKVFEPSYHYCLEPNNCPLY